MVVGEREVSSVQILVFFVPRRTNQSLGMNEDTFAVL